MQSEVYVAIDCDDEDALIATHVPKEFAEALRWLIRERTYQMSKWDYGDIDVQHVREGLTDDSWFWEKGVLNYAGRVRLFGVDSPLGVQALLKLAATIVSMPEHLLRGGVIDSLPKPGLSSGNLE